MSAGNNSLSCTLSVDETRARMRARGVCSRFKFLYRVQHTRIKRIERFSEASGKIKMQKKKKQKSKLLPAPNPRLLVYSRDDPACRCRVNAANERVKLADVRVERDELVGRIQIERFGRKNVERVLTARRLLRTRALRPANRRVFAYETKLLAQRFDVCTKRTRLCAQKRMIDICVLRLKMCGNKQQLAHSKTCAKTYTREFAQPGGVVPHVAQRLLMRVQRVYVIIGVDEKAQSKLDDAA